MIENGDSSKADEIERLVQALNTQKVNDIATAETMVMTAQKILEIAGMERKDIEIVFQSPHPIHDVNNSDDSITKVALLMNLLKRAGFVSHDEARKLWLDCTQPGAQVGKAIMALRKKHENEGKIQNVHGKGYRWIPKKQK